MERKHSNAAKSPKTKRAPNALPSVATAAMLPPTAVVARLGTYALTVKTAELAFLAVITLTAAFFSLKNLGDQCLWQDEAETACIAKTVLKYGYPRGGDGRNCFSQDMERDRLSPRHAWMPFYFAAGSILLFGPTAFAARLPFALFGAATIPLCYFVARRLLQSRRAAAFSAILLTVSVPYLILIRQCRYYSLTAFFTLLGLLAYSCVVRRQNWSVPFLAVALALTFQSNFVGWAVLLATIGIHAFVCHRDRLIAVIIGAAGSFVLVLPWILWLVRFYSSGHVAAGTEGATSAAVFISTAFQYVAKLIQHVFIWVFWLLLFIPAVLTLIKNPRLQNITAAWREPLLLPLYILINIAAFSLLYQFYFFRYLAPAIPMALILAGWILDSAFRFNPVFGVAGVLLAILFSPMHNYLYELTHHYRGPTEGIVEFLKAHAKPDDVVVTSYGDLPIKFYTDLRVVGGLTGEDLTPALNAKWVVPHRFTLCPKDALVQQYMQQHLSISDYAQHAIDAPDIPYDNRECPDEHRFWTASGLPGITILEKIKPKAH